jgi:hypothetical protein
MLMDVDGRDDSYAPKEVKRLRSKPKSRSQLPRCIITVEESRHAEAMKHAHICAFPMAQNAPTCLSA